MLIQTGKNPIWIDRTAIGFAAELTTKIFWAENVVCAIMPNAWMLYIFITEIPPKKDLKFLTLFLDVNTVNTPTRKLSMNLANASSYVQTVITNSTQKTLFEFGKLSVIQTSPRGGVYLDALAVAGIEPVLHLMRMKCTITLPRKF